MWEDIKQRSGARQDPIFSSSRESKVSSMAGSWEPPSPGSGNGVTPEAAAVLSHWASDMAASPAPTEKPAEQHQQPHPSKAHPGWVDAINSVGGWIGGNTSGAYHTVTGLADTAGTYIHNAEDKFDQGIDWGESQLQRPSRWTADKTQNIAVLNTLTQGYASLSKHATQLLGGSFKGASGVVGGVANMAVHPIDTIQGLATMGSHIPGTSFWQLRRLYEQGTGLDDALARGKDQRTASGLGESFKQDGHYWKGVVEKLTEHYRQSIKDGKPMEAVGRGIFDIGSLFIGAGEAKALSKAGETSKVGEMAKAGELSKTGEISKVGGLSDLSKSSEMTEASKAPGRLKTTEEEATAVKTETGCTGDGDGKTSTKESSAKQAGDQHEGDRSNTSHTSDETREHVHKGGTEGDPQSPYRGKWDGKGIHEWDELVRRCKKDGYEIKNVADDSKTGVRRVTIERVGIDSKTGTAVRGTIKKTLYPKAMDAKQIDLAGENALDQAVQKTDGSKLEPFGTKQRSDGTPADGYFEATVGGPKGEPIRLQGWFTEGKDGKKIISSHAPRFDNSWPKLPEREW